MHKAAPELHGFVARQFLVPTNAFLAPRYAVR
jgi:hypothetical protein